MIETNVPLKVESLYAVSLSCRRMLVKRAVTVPVLYLSLACVQAGAQVASGIGAIPQGKASDYFREAQRLCGLDNGKLWGVSTCGPILFVDPKTREVVASQQDGAGLLHRDGDVWLGHLPNSENIANTAVEWSGTYWSEIFWPLSEGDTAQRDTLMEHELYHRIQERLDLSPGTVDNAHLDTVDGRYYLQLEERALAASLATSDHAAHKRAMEDAFLFRARRYQLFPKANEEEKALELNEGLAEYTGVRLGNLDKTAQVRVTLTDLDRQQKVPTIVRSFAYGTGPAYGLLLDEYLPQWRLRVTIHTSLSELLEQAVHWHPPVDLAETTTRRATVYGGPALLKAEQERDALRQATIKKYQALLVQGRTLTLRFRHMKVQFNPQNLQPLGDAGTVYPTIRITDDWGVLEATSGALLKPDWSAVVVSAPEHSGEDLMTGEGWTLHLKGGWKAVAGEKKGDLVLQARKSLHPLRLAKSSEVGLS